MKNPYYLVNGCSFTLGLELNNNSMRYTNILSARLGIAIKDLSSEGKSNKVMYEELYTILLNVRAGDLPPPKAVIWQTTDNYRQYIIRSLYSERTIPGNLSSQIVAGEKSHSAKYQKLEYWSVHKSLKDYKQYCLLNGISYEELYTGVQLHLTTWESEIGLKSSRSSFVGDYTRVTYELEHIRNIFSLQALCKEMNIPLAILNYYEPDKKILKDKMVAILDDSFFIIKNYKHGGLYNHLLWRGYSRPDGFHFDVDAHEFKADIIYDFITSGKQIEVETESHADLEDYPVFNYT
tara:strand:- start:75 stop:953 length:879 start_codon:yes stop_codon:yes gene_type:complete